MVAICRKAGLSHLYRKNCKNFRFHTLSVKKPHFILIGNENEEWEAELEGELNEFEMVNSKDGRGEDDPEWENQIQQMLDAEESTN